MNLLDMVLSDKFSKEEYILKLKNHSFIEVFNPNIENTKTLHNTMHSNYNTKNSIFSLGFYSLNINFIAAVYEIFKNDINYNTTVIANKNYNYSSAKEYNNIGIHHLFKGILNDNDFLEKSSDELKSLSI